VTRRFLLLLPLLALAASGQPPSLSRLHPLGARAGSLVEIEILGESLQAASSVEFDSPLLTWQQTTLREPGRLKGLVSLAPHTPLGPHLLRVRSPLGPSNSLLFNAGQFPAVLEGDHRALPSLPAELYGRLDGPTDIDTYWFSVHAGQRWLFDLRAMDHGSAVEARMALLHANGQKIAYNDDRDHYDENPRLEYTFPQSGVYGLRLDQYRGPRGFTFGKNNAYLLRISNLPNPLSLSPLGARRGALARFSLHGSALAAVSQAYLTPLRLAEYSRMTYPYTMPIRFEPDPPSPTRLPAQILAASPSRLDFAVAIPAHASPGLWKLWLVSPAGHTDALPLEISDLPERTDAQPLPPAPPPYVVNGLLATPGQRQRFLIPARAGQPLRFSTLAAQLGAPFLDTVLTLRDPQGRKLAENDDVVAGWGGLLGNPDSTLFYTPTTSGTLTLELRDRLLRGGPLYPYRLKVESAAPSFQLFTTPENLTVRRGQTTTLKLHLVREAGFSGEVSVRVEGAGPPLSGRFRPDQLFEPNADGADMLIPEIEFTLPAPGPPGLYPLTITGQAPAHPAPVTAHTAVMIGPIYQGDWNFYRRPLPAITLTVVD